MILIVPGFFTLPEHYASLVSLIENAGWKCEVLDFFSRQSSFEAPLHLEEWKKYFFDFLRTKNYRAALGYSMGGRVLLEMGSLWKVPTAFVSTHPGLRNLEERETRLKADKEWAKAFLEDKFHELETKWNSQGVFMSTHTEFKRNELSFDRKKLSQWIVSFSLGKQSFGVETLKSRNTKDYHWLVGANDEKFCKVAQDLKARELPSLPLHKIAEVGHRIPWENPQRLVQSLKELLTH